MFKKKIENAIKIFIDKGYSKKEDVSKLISELPLYKKGTYGPSTSCVRVETDKGNIVFDGGSGLQSYCSDYINGQEFHLFFTHFHWDHICGLPYFRQLYIPNKKINFYSCHENFDEHIKLVFKAPHHPVPYDLLASEKRYHYLQPYKSIQIYDMEITPFCLDHPNKAYGYEVKYENKRLLICFDTEFKRMSRNDLGLDLKYYQNADMILFDAQYTMKEVLNKINWGHCTAQVGVDLCLREKIKELVLVHYDPTYDDKTIDDVSKLVQNYYEDSYSQILEENPKQQPLKIVWGYEGLDLEL